jgi:hypothetical protein
MGGFCFHQGVNPTTRQYLESLAEEPSRFIGENVLLEIMP